MIELPAQARRVRGRAPAYLLSRHALSAEDAVAYTPRGTYDRWWFDRLRRVGAIREASAGRYYIDLVAYHVYAEAISRQLVPISLGVALAIAALAMTFYRYGTRLPFWD